MRLSEYEGDEALDLLADLLDPAITIMADKDIANALKSGNSIGAVKKAIKDHKKEVTTVLALLEGADPATYKPKLITLPAKLLEVLNDPELIQLFTSQSQSKDGVSSGSATETTGGAKE